MSKKPTNKQYRDAARRLLAEEGTLEIDDTAKISTDDRTQGAYVQAWVWVDAKVALVEGTV